MNTPKLRFKEFSGDWEKKKLKKVGKIINGLTYSPKDIVLKDGILVLRSSNIKNNNIDLKDKVFVNVQKFNPVYEHDILICVRNGSKKLIGKNALITKEIENSAFGAFMSIFRSDINNFVFQLFATRKYYKKIDENLGARINSINNSELENFEFYFPSHPEQEKIASFFTAVDTKLSTLKKKKELLEQYKKGVMQKIFSQELRFKDENGQEFPNWEEKKLGEICSFFSGGTPTSSNKNYYIGNIPFIGSGNISSSKVSQYINELALKNSSAKLVEKGDLLYALYGATSGEVAISKLNGAINQAVLCIRINQNESKNYLFQLLKFYKSNIVNTYIQGGQGNLSATIIKELSFNFPSLQEQEKIAHFLSAIDTKIEAVQKQISQTELWKKGLLQKMFV